MTAELLILALAAVAMCIGVGIVAYRAGHVAGQIAGLDHARKHLHLIGRK